MCGKFMRKSYDLLVIVADIDICHVTIYQSRMSVHKGMGDDVMFDVLLSGSRLTVLDVN
jgi:hypothetical protein